MFALKLYRAAHIPDAPQVDKNPLGETFAAYLRQGWLRSPTGHRLLYALARGVWDQTDGERWWGPDGCRSAMELPDPVKFALTLAENSRRKRWTAIPRDIGAAAGEMAAVWRALAREPMDFALTLRFYRDSDLGLLAFLGEEGLPVRVHMGGRRLQGPVDRVFRQLLHLPDPMTMLMAVKRLRKTLYPGWNEDGAPFVPRRAEETGYGDWTFRSRLAAQPYRADGTPLLHSRVPTCVAVTRHGDGTWALEYPTPDTLWWSDLPACVNGYDELMALCGEGLAPGDRRWALVCDTEFSPRISLASPCFGFAYEEASRTLCLTEGEEALAMMRQALTGMLRSTKPGKERTAP